MLEAKLAREAEMCYAAWPCRPITTAGPPAAVTADMVSKRMEEIARQANRLLLRVCGELARKPPLCYCGCNRALDGAIMTAPERRDPEMLARLATVVPRIVNL